MLKRVRPSLQFLSALAGVLVATNPAVGSPRKDQGVTLQLVGTHDYFRAGEPVWKAGNTVVVLVMITNNLKKAVHFSLTSPWFDWDMDLRDEMGNPVPETEQFIEMRERRKNSPITDGRNILVTLKPQETTQDGVEITYRYKLQMPGKYFVQVRGKFPEVSKEPVLSNRLEITITR